MTEESLEGIYSILAQAYIRLQAEEALDLCLRSGEVDPVQEIVEKLVLAGPVSLGTLREILGEAERRRTQIDQDLKLLNLEVVPETSPEHRELNLLGEIIRYLEDWLWGLIYLSARDDRLKGSAFPAKVKYPL